MNCTKQSILSLAACCVLSGLSYAQMDTTGKKAEDPNRTVTPTDHPTDMNAMSGMPAGDMKMDMKSAPKDKVEAMKMYGMDPATAADKMFVWEAGIGNKTEIEGAKAAQSKSDNDDVKKVAKSIEEDHTKAQMNLEKVAASIGVTWPAQLPMEKQQMMQMMSSMPTDDFNKGYIKHMLVDHAKDIAEYKETAGTAKNDMVKMYASSTLPDLMKHNKELNEAAKTMGLPQTMGMESMGMK